MVYIYWVYSMLQIALNQINVTDLDLAIKWYIEKLDFKLSKDNYFILCFKLH